MTIDGGTWVLYLAAIAVIVRYMIVPATVVLVRFVRGWRRVRSR